MSGQLQGLEPFHKRVQNDMANRSYNRQLLEMKNEERHTPQTTSRAPDARQQQVSQSGGVFNHLYYNNDLKQNKMKQLQDSVMHDREHEISVAK